MSEESLEVPVGQEDHIWGNKHAPVTLVEYGDYQCPHCARAYPIVKEIQEQLGEKSLRFVFRNFPLNNLHAEAELAAEAAESAGEQGKFWEMHDLLYENQDNLSGDLVLELAEDLDLDLIKFKAAIESRKYKAHVRKDFMGGVKSGVNGTPSFFINGVRFDGSWEDGELMQALEDQSNV